MSSFDDAVGIVALEVELSRVAQYRLNLAWTASYGIDFILGRSEIQWIVSEPKGEK